MLGTVALQGLNRLLAVGLVVTIGFIAGTSQAAAAPKDERSELHYDVRMETDSRAVLIFGDGQRGQAPPTGRTTTATYRTGAGLSGMVDADLDVAAIWPTMICPDGTKSDDDDGGTCEVYLR